MNLVVAVRKSANCVSLLQTERVSCHIIVDARNTMWKERGLQISDNLAPGWRPIGAISNAHGDTIGVFDIDEVGQLNLALSILMTNGFRSH